MHRSSVIEGLCHSPTSQRSSLRYLTLVKQKWFQQFRLKKPGGAGVKLFQAIKDVNQGCSVTLPSRCRHALYRFCFFLSDNFFSVRRSLTETRQKKGTTRGRALAPPLKVPPLPRPRCAAHRLRCACSLTALAFPRCAAFGVLASCFSGD